MFNLQNRDVKFTTQRQKHHPVDDNGNGNDKNTFDHVFMLQKLNQIY